MLESKKEAGQEQGQKGKGKLIKKSTVGVQKWNFKEVNPKSGSKRTLTVPILKPVIVDSSDEEDWATEKAETLEMAKTFQKEKQKQSFIIETATRLFNYAKNTDKRKINKVDLERILVEIDKSFKLDQGPIRFPVPLGFRQKYDQIICTRVFPFGADLLPDSAGSNFHLLKSHLNKVMEFYLVKPFAEREKLSKAFPVIQLIVDFARHAENFRNKMLKVSLDEPVDNGVYWSRSDALNFSRWIVHEQFLDGQEPKSQNQYCRDDLTMRQASLIPMALFDATRRVEDRTKGDINVFTVTYTVLEKENDDFKVACKYKVHGKVHKLLTGRLDSPLSDMQACHVQPENHNKAECFDELCWCKSLPNPDCVRRVMSLKIALELIKTEFSVVKAKLDGLVNPTVKELKESEVIFHGQLGAVNKKLNLILTKFNRYEDPLDAFDARLAVAQKRVCEATQAERLAKSELEILKGSHSRLMASNKLLSNELTKVTEEKVKLLNDHAIQISSLTEKSAKAADSVAQLSEKNVILHLELLSSHAIRSEEISQIKKPTPVLKPSHCLSMDSQSLFGNSWAQSYLPVSQSGPGEFAKQLELDKSYEEKLAQQIQPQIAPGGNNDFLRPWEDKEGCTLRGAFEPAKKKVKTYLEERAVSHSAVDNTTSSGDDLLTVPRLCYFTQRQ